MNARRGIASLAALLGVLSMAIPQARAAAPMRIVSMNLCTDQLALLLVPPERIVSVSFLGADAAESPLAHLAKGIPINHGETEEVLRYKPDLILTGRYTTGFAKAMLRRLGYPVVEVDSPRSIPEIRDVTLQVGDRLGARDRAEELVTDMERRLSAVAEDVGRRRRYSALTYDANGFTVGRPGVTDDIMRVAGLDNMAPELGVGEYGNLPLETMLAARPQRILHLVYRPGVPSLADAIMRHPALIARTRETPMMTLPGNLLNCATPIVATAAEQIAAATKAAP